MYSSSPVGVCVCLEDNTQYLVSVSVCVESLCLAQFISFLPTVRHSVCVCVGVFCCCSKACSFLLAVRLTLTELISAQFQPSFRQPYRSKRSWIYIPTLVLRCLIRMSSGLQRLSTHKRNTEKFQGIMSVTGDMLRQHFQGYFL